MTILITGGAGFIGSTLAERLLHEGHTVIVLDNFNESYEPTLKWQHVASLQNDRGCLVYRSDIRQPQVVQQLLTDHGVEVVVHLAGLAGVRPSLQNPTVYFDNNLNGTTLLLEAMRAAGVRRLVMASSSSVYGCRTTGPFRETDPVDRPVSPYALSKRAAEMICQQYHERHGLNVYCLRLFTVYGPRQRPDMAIPRFLHQLYAGEPIQLYGDGYSQRDYTYVNDVVEGIVRSAERVCGYEIINLGSALPVSLRALVDRLQDLTDLRTRIDWQAEQPGDVPLTYASIDKAWRLLGYRPATSLDEGLRQMIRHFSPICVPSLL